MKFLEKSRQTLIKEEKRGKRYNSHCGRRGGDYLKGAKEKKWRGRELKGRTQKRRGTWANSEK